MPASDPEAESRSQCPDAAFAESLDETKQKCNAEVARGLQGETMRTDFGIGLIC